MGGAPIFHVNGDSPEHVLHAMGIAVDYRQRFGKDVVIDMWCYRRHGHNEGDEPMFTQPLLYGKIGRHPSVVKIYEKDLEHHDAPAIPDTVVMAQQFEERLEAARQVAADLGPHAENKPDPDTRWADRPRRYTHEAVETGVAAETLRAVTHSITRVPESFNIHPKLAKLLADFAEAVDTNAPLNWSQAEALAFGSLLVESTNIRLSGEDSRRGTFSQRHSVLYDQQNGEPYIPLCNLGSGQGKFRVYDSALAEASVLAFEYGYSLADPDRLILWEAQFGDFANGAQVIIDQFIAGALSKWNCMSGLVMLLPHGWEGQGPDHSNAWLRRYLTLCAEDNIQVCNPSTPAQYFHLLRRQVAPAVSAARWCASRPRACCATRAACRHWTTWARGHFREIIDDDPTPTGTPRRVLFCSGKIYYELIERREKFDAPDVAIVRVEQFYPINEALWEQVGARYHDVPEWVWVSEEPTNFGALGYMKMILSTLTGRPLWYVGRARSASPASGSLSQHKRQQERILERAFDPKALEPDIQDGVAVYTQGNDVWHMKSGSRRSANPSPKEP